ncbi:oxygen-independent coproporphyrinogen III oxidase [Fischerella thermalis]|uniref:oxygen-independent coproporphyrinogen III oxidase n=1 Tax=Fischerella thermalis TaxID=372787 RepID=UPI0019E618EC|nr:oxygen-independent coproporphyrinogen III oxidase [Fischerella thermalis]MBF1989371.1 oxygen-independent coproporphyrinogen III oxidase [Fischerella thermalis M58_A2018_009]MBF2061815.1 oxygen-independent coproporphyrinogen III oxidase [Fischerella thermalis M66_A2018_004]MBF2068637.1 oxygen-independent coproporphyrinogen III oxidase [Fischerella thermalis M48_A2018_028]
MVLQIPGVKFDIDIIKKYDIPTPRYTSYPPATELSQAFTASEFEQAIASSNQRKTPLSLYFHIPFCQSACYFCGCNVVISNNKNIAKPYLEYLGREIKHTASLIDTDRKVVQIHWGGGTPNYLSLEQVENLWNNINRHFRLDPQAEISLEINPRYVDKDYIFFLKEIGFNRISFGIQDFNPQVQAAINRVQPEKALFEVMDWIREAGFQSVNVDLIYGLPYQTYQSFQQTIDKTIELDPDRIAVFNFAYVPWIKPVQKNIAKDALPAPQEKLEILKMTIEELTNSQYLFIGMDHFAKPHDELAIAQRNYTLKRNFQGYTTWGQAELFGFGATSVSMLEDVYAQNHKRLSDYYQTIDAGILPIGKGIKLSEDDILRRDVIMRLMSHAKLHKQDIEDKYQICFDEYFAKELAALQNLESDGLVSLSKNEIGITGIGRLLVRNIAVNFDARRLTQKQKFSRAI